MTLKAKKDRDLSRPRLDTTSNLVRTHTCGSRILRRHLSAIGNTNVSTRRRTPHLDHCPQRPHRLERLPYTTERLCAGLHAELTTSSFHAAPRGGAESDFPAHRICSFFSRSIYWLLLPCPPPGRPVCLIFWQYCTIIQGKTFSCLRWSVCETLTLKRVNIN